MKLTTKIWMAVLTAVIALVCAERAISTNCPPGQNCQTGTACGTCPSYSDCSAVCLGNPGTCTSPAINTVLVSGGGSDGLQSASPCFSYANGYCSLSIDTGTNTGTQSCPGGECCTQGYYESHDSGSYNECCSCGN